MLKHNLRERSPAIKHSTSGTPSGTTIGSLGRRPARWIIRTATAVLLIGGLAAIAAWRMPQRTPWYRQEVAGSAAPSPATADAMEPRIAAFCGSCHAVPSPQSFPRDAWHDEVLRGYEFYARSGMTHLDPPPIHATVDYFRSRAPEELVFPAPAEATTPLRARFTVDKRSVDRHPTVAPAVAHLRWARLETDARPVLLVCDMRDGNVTAVDPNPKGEPPRVLARLNNPCRVEPCDLDGDGAIDLVVADLGSTIPYDHDLGRVVWLRRDQQRNRWEQTVVASGLGRVADVRPGDFDRDGDVDLVVADFGLHRTGQVLWLENTLGSDPVFRFQTEKPGLTPPKFLPRQIDPRPGAIHVPVADLDGDGRLDFLALISQQYECVEAFTNRGSDASIERSHPFVRKRLWTAPDLTFGSSGIEPVDLDGDGDLDVLYANGDAFDNNYANPSHGIQWLENLGNGRFVCHRLTDLVGAYSPRAGDVDLDGDLDILAVAWLPEQVKPASLRDRPLPSIVCLEQTAPGVFARHTLEVGSPYYATLELADFDGDGDLDFAVAPHMQTTRHAAPGLAIWWNELKEQKRGRNSF